MFQPLFETPHRPFCIDTKLVPGGSSLKKMSFEFGGKKARQILFCLHYSAAITFLCVKKKLKPPFSAFISMSGFSWQHTKIEASRFKG